MCTIEGLDFAAPVLTDLGHMAFELISDLLGVDQVLGELGGFTRTRVTSDDCEVVAPDCLDYPVFVLEDRQALTEFCYLGFLLLWWLHMVYYKMKERI